MTLVFERDCVASVSVGFLSDVMARSGFAIPSRWPERSKKSVLLTPQGSLEVDILLDVLLLGFLRWEREKPSINPNCTTPSV
jgi:hypothetical protein